MDRRERRRLLAANLVRALAGARSAAEVQRRLATVCGLPPARVGKLATRCWRRLEANVGGPLFAAWLASDPFVARLACAKRGAILVGPDIAPTPRTGPAAIWRTPAELADALSVSLPQLNHFADLLPWGDGRRRNLYRCRWMPKRSGGFRLLETPIAPLKRVQRTLLRLLLDQVSPHPAAHGFRRGGSPVTALAPHVGQAWLLRLDLEDFFPSVRFGRVMTRYVRLGAADPVARLLAGLCTHAADPEPPPGGIPWETGRRLRQRHLPQGAPTSPALANLAADRLDRRLAAWADRRGFRFTRYADDLLVSGGPELRAGIARALATVRHVAAEEGFRLRRGKARLMGAGQRQAALGLVANAKLAVPRKERERLKAILHAAACDGLEAANREGHADFRAHLAGRVAWVASVDPRQGARLQALLDRLS